MESTEERKRRIYGPIRNLQVEEIRTRLSKSCVLKPGEYNYTDDKLKAVNYGTSYDTDFSGAIPDPSNKQEQKGQLTHHFELGNDSGANVDVKTYQDSTTKTDFQEKPWCKLEMVEGDKNINWPDMAPRYMTSRKTENSEYASNYNPGLEKSSGKAALFPRLNTSKMQLPIDQTRFKRHRGTNITLGSDNPSIFSESQRVYGVGDAVQGHSLAFSPEEQATTQVSKAMKELGRTSHVFRYGDYDGIKGNYDTTVNDEFGPRTLPPAETAARALKAADKAREQAELKGEELPSSKIGVTLPDDNTRTSHLAAYARDVIVPDVFKGAADGKTYQSSAHFKFGHDPTTLHSMYGKDYALAAMAKRGPPQQTPTKAAGNILQNDPAYSAFGSTSNNVDYSYQPAQPYRNAEGKTLMEVNLDKRDHDNIIMSYDLNRHAQDRQRSLAHSDYVRPPPGFKAVGQLFDAGVSYDYLTPDDALPYPGLNKMQSEAKNNYIGTFMTGGHATGRRLQKDAQTRSRLSDGKSTHFVVGYNPTDFTTETQIKYLGEKKNDQGLKPAGKTENVAPVKFTSLTISENTQDLRAADPKTVSNNESLMARAAYASPQPEHAMRTSVMKADFKPLPERRFTDAQVRTMRDMNTKVGKEIATTHLFHTDNSGRNNFQTTAMNDFIKPETMTGQKFLAAR
ncbi:uncharacterized protein LOC110442576 [Mizuhopecten yessoensis]|uniref:Uncharacterized protein n=2 Tax=Mizuhopecten yessoensis TaxID=6573 RepID=A0A210PGW8_MIZYE|nr:uncharacterized protein LOC110442576 [Mizuhopecten yessoensis]OWF35734.1 hypothetical protein KP79_PYT10572 [Mizuhopecten yessoensis]